MKNSIIQSGRDSRKGRLAGVAATLAVAALGFAGAAQARDNVSFSVGINSPGVQVGVTNAYPVYSQPRVIYTQPQVVYTQPRPVYVQPQPVYVQPRPVYVQPAPVYYGGRPVYVQPAPVYHGHPGYWNNGHRHGRHQSQGRPNFGPNYAPVYYQR